MPETFFAVPTRQAWIHLPAFAGMMEKFAGMTGKLWGFSWR